MAEFAAQTGWHPTTVGLFAGALAYPRYGFVKKRLMRRIARGKPGLLGTDLTHDYDYTDWDAVRRFVEDFLTERVPAAAPRADPQRQPAGREFLWWRGDYMSTPRTRSYTPVENPADRPRVSRTTVRVLLLNPDGDTLLFEDSDPGLNDTRWWVTPGGGIDPGETETQAAVREVAEETGFVLSPDDLLGPVARRHVVHGDSDQVIEQDEAFYLAQVETVDVDVSAHTAEEQITFKGYRWFSTEDLRTTDDWVWPRAGGDPAADRHPGALAGRPRRPGGVDRAGRERVDRGRPRRAYYHLLPREPPVGRRARRRSDDAQVETLEFQAEARQLLQLMIHSIYSNKDIFLRELISNASDALDKLRLEALRDKDLDADTDDLHIELVIDRGARTLTVRDNGIGMTRDEVVAADRHDRQVGHRRAAAPSCASARTPPPAAS